MTYEEFKNIHKEPKYFGLKCYIAGCNSPAEYEGGDARYYCGVCEKHSNIYERWQIEKERERKPNKILKPFPKFNWEDQR